jgi:hypothetical protein
MSSLCNNSRRRRRRRRRKLKKTKTQSGRKQFLFFLLHNIAAELTDVDHSAASLLAQFVTIAVCFVSFRCSIRRPFDSI